MTNSNLTTVLLLKKFHSAALSDNGDFFIFFVFSSSESPFAQTEPQMFDHPSTTATFSHTFNHLS